ADPRDHPGKHRIDDPPRLGEIAFVDPVIARILKIESAHLRFAVQPDLLDADANAERVRGAFDRALVFWLGRLGVDGRRGDHGRRDDGAAEAPLSSMGHFFSALKFVTARSSYGFEGERAMMAA